MNIACINLDFETKVAQIHVKIEWDASILNSKLRKFSYILNFWFLVSQSLPIAIYGEDNDTSIHIIFIRPV